MSSRRTRRRSAFLAVAVIVGGGSAAAIAQQGQGGVNGHGGVGKRPNMPTVPAARGPQPSPPPEAVAASERRRAAEARGEYVPMAVWDPVTGDLAKNPDGSLVMDDQVSVDPATGRLARHPDGSLVVGPRRGSSLLGCPRPGECK